MGSGALFFCYNLERELNYKHHFFTYFLLVALGLLITDIFLLFTDPSNMALLCWIPFILILSHYVYKFMKNLKGLWKLKIISFLIGFIIFALAYLALSDYLVLIFGAISRLIGNLFIILGMSMISFVLIGLPRMELEWCTKIRSVIVLHRSGVSVSAYDFREDLDEESTKESMTQFIAGGLTGISKIIEEIIQSKDKDPIKQKLEVMDHKDVKIMFHYGSYLTGVVIVEEVLGSYKFKLKKLINYLEILYQDLLPKWKSEDLFQFQPVKGIIKRFFQ